MAKNDEKCPDLGYTDAEIQARKKMKKRVEKKVKGFMKAARAAISAKCGNTIPPEFECNLLLLETYFGQFLEISEELKDAPLVENSRYGKIPSPLLTGQSKVALRLESILKSLGLTFKESLKLDLVEVQEEDSPLEAFVKIKRGEAE